MIDLDRFPDVSMQIHVDVFFVITNLHWLSQELWMAIFEYLDIVTLYRYFYNINHHLNSIINDKRICLQADLSRIRCEYILSPFLFRIRQQIVRLKLSNIYYSKQIETFCRIFPQFNQFLALRSLTLVAIDASDLLLISIGLPNLIHLIKLDVTTCQISTDNEIDQASRVLISASPTVRTLRLHLCHELMPQSITINSSLEYLSIDTWCDLMNIYDLLIHTPSLKTLDISLTIQRSLSAPFLSLLSLTVLHLNIWFLNDTIKPIEYFLQSMPHLHILTLNLTVQHPICIEQIQQLIIDGILLSELTELRVKICLLNSNSFFMTDIELVLQQWYKTQHKPLKTFFFHVYFRNETNYMQNDLLMIDLK